MVSNGRILVVDDESSIREVCRRILEPSGYGIETAETGEKALQQMQNQTFDFVLTDIRMPGSVDGTHLVEIIKEKSPLTDVVVMTAAPALETAISTLKSGAYDYLIKPFNREFLLSVVNRCFEKRRLSDELQRERLLRQELQSAYAELQKVEKLKESFLARINHELRTPFISSFFTMDEIESRRAYNESDIPRLRLSLNQVWEIVQNIMLFSDLRNTTESAVKAAIPWSEILARVIEKYRSRWEDKRLQVTCTVDPSVKPLRGDPELMETALKHLLLNAIQFSPKGSTVWIDVQNVQGGARISFKDQGIGIPQDKLSAVFDSFYQVADYLTREVGGLGLGLAIVRRIVEAHGGTIDVRSREGEGSTFTMTFPQQRV